jgi:2'-5' RNA ligase
VRTFVAIDIPRGIRQRLGELSAELRGREKGVTWVGPDAMHLTLRFLGETTERQAGEVAAALDHIAAGVPAFAVRLSGVGAFPGFDAARVLFVGIDRGEEELTRLAEAVEEAARQAGFPPERRPFRPHVTVGRVRQGRRLAHPDGWRGMAPEEGFGSFEARSVGLIRSDLRPDGPRYSSLADASLGSSRGAGVHDMDQTNARRDDDER